MGCWALSFSSGVLPRTDDLLIQIAHCSRRSDGEFDRDQQEDPFRDPENNGIQVLFEASAYLYRNVTDMLRSKHIKAFS